MGLGAALALAVRGEHALGDERLRVEAAQAGDLVGPLQGLEAGDPLQASGPFGRFCLQPGDLNRRYLLIVTGTRS